MHSEGYFKLHNIGLLSEQSDFHSVVIFGVATLRRFSCFHAIAVWRQSLLFANVKLHCFEAEYIRFMRLHHNVSTWSDSGVIFIPPRERNDFHSDWCGVA